MTDLNLLHAMGSGHGGRTFGLSLAASQDLRQHLIHLYQGPIYVT